MIVSTGLSDRIDDFEYIFLEVLDGSLALVNRTNSGESSVFFFLIKVVLMSLVCGCRVNMVLRSRRANNL